VQLCHPDLHNDFPPLRTSNTTAQHLPTQLTSFIGRQTEIDGVRAALLDNRVVTLFGAGGVGKTRLAVQVAATQAIAYAQRGRGERKRASSGWASLTPAELDVARLVSEGLGNKEVATRLFVSPRTVQAHITHIYTKLGLTSRVQLAQEAARHSG
jgi:DNA-binding CsgD family transcriptional regulator